MTTPERAHKFIVFLLFSSFAVQIALSSRSVAFMLLAGQVISLLIPLLGYLALTGGGFRDRLGLNPCKGRDILQGIGITLLLQPFLLLLAASVERITGNPMGTLMETLAETPAWITVTGLAVMPALIEEMVFRGFLLGSYRRMPLWGAALLNGAVFGMFHMNLYQFSYALVLGSFFSVVTRRSGSVIPAMVMHFLNNLLSVALVYQLDTPWYMGLDDLLKAGTAPGPGLLAGLLAAALSLGAALLLVRMPSENLPLTAEERPADEAPQASGLLHDWALMFLFLIFSGLVLVLPAFEFFTNR